MYISTAKTLIDEKVNKYLTCKDSEEREEYFELTNLIRNMRDLVEREENADYLDELKDGLLPQTA